MSSAPRQESLKPAEIYVWFNTNERLPAQLVAEFIQLFAQQTDLELELVEALAGTMLMKFAAVGGGLAAMAGFVLDVSKEITTPETPMSACVARMMIDHAVVETQIASQKQCANISREMVREVARIEEQRLARQTEPPVDSIVTESGERIDPSPPLNENAFQFVKEDYNPNFQYLQVPDAAKLFERPSQQEEHLTKMRGYFASESGGGLYFVPRVGSAIRVRMNLPPRQIAERGEAVIFTVPAGMQSQDVVLRGTHYLY